MPCVCFNPFNGFNNTSLNSRSKYGRDSFKEIIPEVKWDEYQLFSQGKEQVCKISAKSDHFCLFMSVGCPKVFRQTDRHSQILAQLKLRIIIIMCKSLFPQNFSKFYFLYIFKMFLLQYSQQRCWQLFSKPYKQPWIFVSSEKLR